MKMKYFVTVLGLLFLTVPLQAKTSDEFPARKLFPAVPYIEIDDLHKTLSKSIVVDVRSAYEFETLRIKGAINISLGSPGFVDEMARLRKDNPNTPIVTYCNGKTCKKSYEAVQKCRDRNIPNVIAYDAGIMDWARKYPQDSVLLGVSPVNPQRLIDKAEFSKRLVAPEKFEAMLTDRNVIVVDVRDRFQREGLSLFPGIDQQAYLDDKQALDKYINQAKRENKTLLIYDAAGKQVQWLQYYLEDRGLPNYGFMKGGASAYYANLRKQFVQ